MTFSTEGPNPLRPYYIPPSIGLDALQHAPSPGNASAAASSSQSSGGSLDVGSSARQLLYDFDYSTYVDDSSPTVTKAVKNLFNRAVWVYTGILISQPFDLTKTVLQVYVAEDEAASRDPFESSSTRRGRRGSDDDDDARDEEEAFHDVGFVPSRTKIIALRCHIDS